MQFLDELRQLPGFASVKADAKYPSVYLHQAIGNSESMAKFKDAVMEVRKALK
jgi:hypothetical protein